MVDGYTLWCSMDGIRIFVVVLVVEEDSDG